jgi:hypothetical protein
MKQPASTLQVLRELAIDRVQTVIPGFGPSELDSWIMQSGYAGALSPHSETKDLLRVYAASLANAGGAKPRFDAFGSMICQAMGAFISNGGIARVPNLTELARECGQHLACHELGGEFVGNVASLARGDNGNKLMRGLLSSVVAFSAWLHEKHSGSASVLHAALTTNVDPRRTGHGLPVLRDIDRLPWVGIAVAANFLKDSQVPGLRARCMTPKHSASVLAGWFAKPDLHVARLMGYVTGRLPQPRDDPSRFKLGEALKRYGLEPEANFSGHYPNLVRGDANDIKVIADIHEWAVAANTSPLEIDRILYLIGVRETIVQGVAVREPWYPKFVAAVDACVARGVPRKS